MQTFAKLVRHNGAWVDSGRRMQAEDRPQLAPSKPARYALLADEKPTFDADVERLVFMGITFDDVEEPTVITYGYEVQEIPIAEDADRVKADLAAARWAYVQAGTVTVGGVVIKTDKDSRDEIEALHGVLRDEIITSVDFKPANGNPVTVDLAAAAAIRAAVTLFYQAARSHEASLVTAINDAVAGDDRTAVLAVVWTPPS